MADFSLVEKLKIVLDTIFSTPLFSVSAFLGLILIVVMIIFIIKKKRLPKQLYIFGWVFVLGFIIFKYSKIIPTLIDNLFDVVFKSLYFPSVGLYIFIILLVNIIFIVMTVQKNVRKSYKIVSCVTAITLNVLFIISAGIITKNKIDITADVSLYSNSTLLVLLQVSMGIFLSFIIVTLFIRIYVKMKILDSVKFGGDYAYPEMETVVTEKPSKLFNQVIVRKIIKPFMKNDSDKVNVRKVIKINNKKQDDVVVRKIIKR